MFYCFHWVLYDLHVFLIPVCLFVPNMHTLLLIVKLFDILDDDRICLLRQNLSNDFYERYFEFSINGVENTVHVSPIMYFPNHSFFRYGIF